MAAESCEFNIEFAHLYYQDLVNRNFSLLRQAIEAVRGVLRVLEGSGVTWSLVVMIDDYGAEAAVRDAAPLREFLAQARLEAHHVAYESDLGAVAGTLVDSLRPRSLRKMDDSILFRSNSTDPHLVEPNVTQRRPKSLLLGTAPQVTLFRQRRARSVMELVLANEAAGERRYGCALLASCWTLARMGVAPYLEALRLDSLPGAPPFVGGRLITVLPISYLKVESAVIELLGENRNRRIRSLRKHIQYVFHPTED